MFIAGGGGLAVKKQIKTSQPMAAALSIQFERGLKAILDGLVDGMKPVDS